MSDNTYHTSRVESSGGGGRHVGRTPMRDAPLRPSDPHALLRAAIDDTLFKPRRNRGVETPAVQDQRTASLVSITGSGGAYREESYKTEVSATSSRADIAPPNTSPSSGVVDTPATQHPQSLNTTPPRTALTADAPNISPEPHHYPQQQQNGALVASNSNSTPSQQLHQDVSSVGGGGGEGGDIFHSLYSAAAKVGVSHNHLLNDVRRVEGRVEHLGSDVAYIKDEQRHMGIKLSDYMKLVTAINEENTKRREEEAATERQLLLTGRQREDALQSQVRNAAIHASNMEKQMSFMKEELQGGLYETMKRVGRIVSQAGEFSSKQLRTVNSKVVAADYLRKWRLWAIVYRTTVAKFSQSSNQLLMARYYQKWFGRCRRERKVKRLLQGTNTKLARYVIQGWATWLVRQRRCRLIANTMQRRTVRGFLTQMFNRWQNIAQIRKNSRSAAYMQLSAKSESQLRRNFFHRWVLLSKSTKQGRNKVAITNALGQRCVVDTRRRYYAVWKVYCIHKLQVKRDLMRLEHGNFLRFGRAAYYRWVKFADQRIFEKRLDGTVKPLREQLNYATREIHILKTMVQQLLERQKGVEDTVEQIAKVKVSVKAIDPAYLRHINGYADHATTPSALTTTDESATDVAEVSRSTSAAIPRSVAARVDDDTPAVVVSRTPSHQAYQQPTRDTTRIHNNVLTTTTPSHTTVTRSRSTLVSMALSGGSNSNHPEISTDNTDYIKRAVSSTSPATVSVSPAPRSSSKQTSRPVSRASSAEKRAARVASGSNIAVAYEPSSSSVHHVRVEPSPPPGIPLGDNKPSATYYEPNRQGGTNDDNAGRIVWSPSGARRQQHDGSGGFKSLTTNPVMPINDRSSQASSHVSSYPTHNMIGVNDNPGDAPRGSSTQSGLGNTPVSRKSSVLSALSRGSMH